MTPSRVAAIAATWGTPPESTASRSTLSMAVPSTDALMCDLPESNDAVPAAFALVITPEPDRLSHSEVILRPAQAFSPIPPNLRIANDAPEPRDSRPKLPCQLTLTLVSSNVSSSYRRQPKGDRAWASQWRTSR